MRADGVDAGLRSQANGEGRAACRMTHMTHMTHFTIKAWFRIRVSVEKCVIVRHASYLHPKSTFGFPLAALPAQVLHHGGNPPLFGCA
jgi:hypothetical protein